MSRSMPRRDRGRAMTAARSIELIEKCPLSFRARPGVTQGIEGQYLKSFVALVWMCRAVLHDNINKLFHGGIARDVGAQDRINLSLPGRLRLPQQFYHHTDAGHHSEALALNQGIPLVRHRRLAARL